MPYMNRVHIKIAICVLMRVCLCVSKVIYEYTCVRGVCACCVYVVSSVVIN